MTAMFGSYPCPKVKIAITSECNLNCFYCNVLGNARFKTNAKYAITPSDIGRLGRCLAEKGITQVEISGCEPLLRKDASTFVKALVSVKAIKSITLKTNAAFLKNHADSLRKAGLKKLVIGLPSLNFAKYQKITSRDNLFRVLDGLEKAERLKFNDLVVNYIALNGINTDEMIDFAMLTKTRPLHVRFIEFLRNSADPTHIDDKLNMSILYIKRTIDGFQKLFPVEETFDFNGHQRFRFRDGVGHVSFINASDIIKSRTMPTIYLSATGDISNSTNPAKTLNIIRELRKESKDNSLSKIIDRQINQVMGKRKPEKPSKKKLHVRHKEARA